MMPPLLRPEGLRPIGVHLDAIVSNLRAPLALKRPRAPEKGAPTASLGGVGAEPWVAVSAPCPMRLSA